MNLNLKHRLSLGLIVPMSLAVGLLASSPAFSLETGKEEAAIARAIGRIYDTPQAKVESRPISISGQYAVAAWQQGEKAGRALLKHEKDGWQIMLCAGVQLRSASGLQEAGLSAGNARDLHSKVEHAERNLSPALRARLDAFAQMPSHHAHHPQSDHAK